MLVSNSTSSKSRSSLVRKVPLIAPWRWLVKGFEDLRRSRLYGLIYGVCFVLIGVGIDKAHQSNLYFNTGLIAGFMFVGPFLAVGLYELSRQVERGDSTDLLLSLFSWCRNPRGIGQFAVILSGLLVLWLWVSMSLMGEIPQSLSGGRELLDVIGIVIAWNLLMLGAFMTWLVIAIIVYVISVVSVPLLLDKPVNAWTAMVFSARSCAFNLLPMTGWALIILIIIGMSLYYGYFPLLVAGPWIGHASWHAYRDLRVDRDQISVEKNE